MFVGLFKIYLFVYFKGTVRQRERQKEKRVFICWLTLQIAVMGKTGLGQSQELRASLGSPMWVKEPKYLSHPLLLFQAIWQGAGLQWSRCDTDWCPYSMSALQIAAQLTVHCSGPYNFFFYMFNTFQKKIFLNVIKPMAFMLHHSEKKTKSKVLVQNIRLC